jgi:hypothetical protein
MHWIHDIAQLIRNHLSEIAFTISTMVFVVGGPYLNRGTKAFTQPLHWFIRYGIFVLLATVGYGLLAHYVYQILRQSLAGLDNMPLLMAVIGSHLVLAWFLKRENSI